MLTAWSRHADRLQRIGFFVRQDLIDRYRADALGAAWNFIQPLMTIALFSAVFSTLMRARLPNIDHELGYTVYLISGVLTWGCFSQILGRLSGWYRDRAGLYKKLRLGLFAPPLSVVVSEVLVLMIGLAIFAMFLVLIQHPIGWAWIAVAGVVLLLSTLAYSLGIVLGLLEVFLPDIRRLVPLLVQLGFWLTPIVYTLDVLPEELRSVVAASPLTEGLAAIQQAIVYDRWPQFNQLTGLTALTGTSLLLSVWLGRRLRKAVRDAL
jgi:lipopolysaccharide transport system permease protein